MYEWWQEDVDRMFTEISTFRLKGFSNSIKLLIARAKRVPFVRKNTEDFPFMGTMRTSSS